MKMTVVGVVASLLIAGPAAAPSGQYKGVPFGIPCEEAKEKLQAKGVQLGTYEEKASEVGVAPGTALVRGQYNCASETNFDNAYAITPGNVGGRDCQPASNGLMCTGGVDFRLYCRADKYVGVALSAEQRRGDSPSSAVTELKKAAGPAVRTVKEEVSDATTIFASALAPAKGGVRYLVTNRTNVTRSVFHEGAEYTYYVWSESDDRQATAAVKKCFADYARREREEQQAAKKGAQDAFK
jgi:hypothetical protein